MQSYNALLLENRVLITLSFQLKAFCVLFFHEPFSFLVDAHLQTLKQ